MLKRHGNAMKKFKKLTQKRVYSYIETILTKPLVSSVWEITLSTIMYSLTRGPKVIFGTPLFDRWPETFKQHFMAAYEHRTYNFNSQKGDNGEYKLLDKAF